MESIYIRPDPHPLDFDWRFTAETTNKLLRKISDKNNILLVGTPTLAYELQLTNSNYTLVDRQYVPGVKNQVNLDISICLPLTQKYDAIIIDSPWYEEDFFRWVSWSSSCITADGVIYSSLWPIETRTSSRMERTRIFNWLKKWSKYSIEGGYLSYQQPKYELIAKQVNSDFDNEKKWSKGDMLAIYPYKKVEIAIPLERAKTWVRYTIGTLQLAVRIDDIQNEPKVTTIESAQDWIWPHISKRAKDRDEIGLWSSRNFVAKLDGSTGFINILEAYLGLAPNKKCLLSEEEQSWYQDFFESWSIPSNCPEIVKVWKCQE